MEPQVIMPWSLSFCRSSVRFTRLVLKSKASVMPEQSDSGSGFACLKQRTKCVVQLFGSFYLPLPPRRQHQIGWTPIVRLALSPCVVISHHRVIWQIHHEINIEFFSFWHAQLFTLHVMRSILLPTFGFNPMLRHIRCSEELIRRPSHRSGSMCTLRISTIRWRCPAQPRCTGLQPRVLEPTSQKAQFP